MWHQQQWTYPEERECVGSAEDTEEVLEEAQYIKIPINTVLHFFRHMQSVLTLPIEVQHFHLTESLLKIVFKKICFRIQEGHASSVELLSF